MTAFALSGLWAQDWVSGSATKCANQIRQYHKWSKHKPRLRGRATYGSTYLRKPACSFLTVGEAFSQTMVRFTPAVQQSGTLCFFEESRPNCSRRCPWRWPPFLLRRVRMAWESSSKFLKRDGANVIVLLLKLKKRWTEGERYIWCTVKVWKWKCNGGNEQVTLNISTSDVNPYRRESDLLSIRAWDLLLHESVPFEIVEASFEVRIEPLRLCCLPKEHAEQWKWYKMFLIVRGFV